jgi:hydrogenase maturation factor
VQPGKLPAALLERFLSSVPVSDRRVVVGPGTGRDAAVIDTGGDHLLIAKTDPITFASEEIGWYAVHVNENDIACLGGVPRWFLATVLLPEGASESLAERIFSQIAGACGEISVTLVGGHTEITIGLDRPIVAGTMLGEVHRDSLVVPGGALPGDALILAGGIAVEGTAVLAREAADRLRALGVSPDAITEAAAYLTNPGIRVSRAAQAACGTARVHAMHDPTEGGLATALQEMATASGTAITVDRALIHVLPRTREICDAAGLDPLGTLASGALLVAIAEEDCPRVLEAVRGERMLAERIGTFEAGEPRVIMLSSGARTDAPQFARDEVARFLSSA